jgi:hypothetical protein
MGGPLPSKVFVWGGEAILQVRNLVKYTVYYSCICSPHNPIPIPPPPPVTHCIECIARYLFTQGSGGEGEVNWREGSYKKSQKYQHY